MVAVRHLLNHKLPTAMVWLPSVLLAKLPTAMLWLLSVRAGKLVYEKLAARGAEFEVRGLVRSEASKEALGGGPRVYLGSITEPESGDLEKAVEGAKALVIVTSAVPKMKPGFDPKSGKRPEFYYEDGQYPEQVRRAPTCFPARLWDRNAWLCPGRVPAPWRAAVLPLQAACSFSFFWSRWHLPLVFCGGCCQRANLLSECGGIARPSSWLASGLFLSSWPLRCGHALSCLSLSLSG